MADLVSINGKAITGITSFNGKALTEMTSINGLTISSGDSVSANPLWLNFDWSGTAYDGYGRVQVTSSGTWSATSYSDPDFIILGMTASGSSGQYCYIYLGMNMDDWAKLATIRITVGSAHVDIEICQDGTMETCG